MALVTDDEVKQIIDTTKDTTPFIDIADLIVSEDLVDSELSDARRKEVERYLAAHLVAISEGDVGVTFTKTGASSEGYADYYASGLNSSRYGQQAIILDTSGVLASKASSKPKARFRIV